MGEHLQGWEIEPLQISRGPLNLSLAALAFDDLAVSAISCNRAVSDRVGINPFWIQVVVLLAPQRWNAFWAEASQLVILAPGTENRSLVPEGFRCVEAAVRMDLAEKIGIVDWGERRGADAVLPLPRSTTLVVTAWVAELLRSHATNALLSIGPEANAALRERAIEFVRFLRDAVAPLSTHPKIEPRRVARYDLASAALDLIDQAPIDEMPSVAGLAQRLRISDRTLQSAFHDVFGVTPSRYLLARRLNDARRLLIDRSERAVTDAALDTGFEHFGRFSQHYRLLFGECPSQTLRRARQLPDPGAKSGSGVGASRPWRRQRQARGAHVSQVG